MYENIKMHLQKEESQDIPKKRRKDIQQTEQQFALRGLVRT